VDAKVVWSPELRQIVKTL